jgi:DnaJ-class molecular chaperone
MTVSSAQPVKVLTGARAYRGPDGLRARRCSKHGAYTVKADAKPGCPKCRKNAQDRERHRAARLARSLTCDKCKTALRVPAKLCGFCMGDDFDVEAALAAQDALTEGTR